MTVAPVLALNGTATTTDSSARVGRVQVLGVEDRFWSLGADGAPIGRSDGDALIVNEDLESHHVVRI